MVSTLVCRYMTSNAHLSDTPMAWGRSADTCSARYHLIHSNQTGICWRVSMCLTDTRAIDHLAHHNGKLYPHMSFQCTYKTPLRGPFAGISQATPPTPNHLPSKTNGTILRPTTLSFEVANTHSLYGTLSRLWHNQCACQASPESVSNRHVKYTDALFFRG